MISIPHARAKFGFLETGEPVFVDQTWYLYLSRVFSDGSVFSTDQNVLAITEFMTPAAGGSESSSTPAATDFSDANNILANQEFGG